MNGFRSLISLCESRWSWSAEPRIRAALICSSDDRDDMSRGGEPMKKIVIRKPGAVRLTSVAAALYGSCGGNTNNGPF